jgi:hypothetical protein
MKFEEPSISREDKIFNNIKADLSFGEERGVDWDIRPGQNGEVLSFLSGDNDNIKLYIEDVSTGNCTDHNIDSLDKIEEMKNWESISEAMVEKALSIFNKKQ